MEKRHLEKEKILHTFFQEYDLSSLVLKPDSFFLLENGILDAKVISQLQAEVEALIGDGCFTLIDKDEVNAFAMEADGIPIIALYTGTIQKILSAASILMLSDAFLPEVGDMAACYHEIPSDLYFTQTNENNSSILKMAISGDPCRANIGYMIACLAIHFKIGRASCRERV